MRDGMGVELLRQAGIRTAWLTREESPIVAARAKKLQIDALWSRERDKRQALPRLVQDMGVDARAVAYIGDDVNDLAALTWVAEAGLAACPSDAVPEVEAVAQFVTTARGGYGAFRELCDLILSSRKEHK
jgi:YrbI family 3-deoxy-D-manno-octulosonate 8-phosphate phosphatase